MVPHVLVEADPSSTGEKVLAKLLDRLRHSSVYYKCGVRRLEHPGDAAAPAAAASDTGKDVLMVEWAVAVADELVSCVSAPKPPWTEP